MRYVNQNDETMFLCERKRVNGNAFLDILDGKLQLNQIKNIYI